MTYLINPTATSANPEDARNGWKKCFYSQKALGKEFIIVCEFRDYTYTPLTRQFAIRVGYNQGVGLREVEVFGFGKRLEKKGISVITVEFKLFEKSV